VAKTHQKENRSARCVEERRLKTSFAAVADDFVARIGRRKLRTADVMEHDLKRLIEWWGARPITEIGADDVSIV